MTGTSTNTPTTVAIVTPELRPNRAIAIATDNSKKLDAPINAAGAPTSCGIFQYLLHKYAIKNIKIV